MRPFPVRFASTAGLLTALLALPAAGQEGGSAIPGGGLSSPESRFRLRVEVKAAFRSSRDVSFVFVPADVKAPIELRTVAPGSSAELPNVALTAEADLTPDISAKAEVHVLDLYSRNPTSSDSRVLLREAWIRFGKKYEALRPIPGTSVYVQAGLAPRFSKQLNRRFESYGLWGTAVSRFEEVGAEAGGTFGTVVYWRAAVASGNPLFMRDPNALAGDNGTPERTVGSTVPVVYNSGFPILYDTKPGDLNASGKFQAGGGLGVRLNFGEDRRDGVDLLGWYFRRRLADRVAIHGTFYSGDLRLLQGFDGSFPLPIDGDLKEEYGANLEVRLGGFQLFGQYVKQTIAGLPRKGYEVEGAYRVPLNGLFLSGETPILNWVQPVLRYSRIDSDFELRGFVAPTFFWYWDKLDAGVRVGILRGVDLTAEFARVTTTTVRGDLHPDEFLATLRAAF